MKTFQNNKNICHAEPLVVLSDSEGSVSASANETSGVKLNGGRSRKQDPSLSLRTTWRFGMTRRGFTLAEVLITLGVIGVVAALVLPGVINNIEKKRIESQFVVATNILANAVRAAEGEYGPAAEWDFNFRTPADHYSNFETSKMVAETYFLPYLDVAYVCSGNAKNTTTNNSNICFGGRDSKGNKNMYFGANGYAVSTSWPNTGYMFMLKNGMGVLVKATCNNCCYCYISVLVDIDGPKGNSIAGRDVFMYTIGVNKGDDWTSINNIERTGFGPGGPCSNAARHYYFTKFPSLTYATRNQCWNNCDPSQPNVVGQENFGQNAICGCSVDIALNNWKIPNNYPLKQIPKAPKN